VCVWYVCVCVCGVCVCVCEIGAGVFRSVYLLKGTNCKKKLMKCYIWSIPLYGAETWTLRKVDQEYLESFEMWCWRRMKRLGGPNVREMKKICIQSMNKEIS